mmetsp:Transcript_854/g.3538  ORF Transcript_854/g.3538 Transcript_854/m.3538 type:complete len:264 (-) Transcript_854:8753-9544(-)
MLVIELLAEEHKVGHGLKQPFIDSPRHRLAESVEHGAALAGIGYFCGQGSDALRRVEDAVQQVEREIPAEAGATTGAGEVQSFLHPERPIQLALQGMQQQIDFVENERRRLENLQNLDDGDGLLLQLLHLVLLQNELGHAPFAAQSEEASGGALQGVRNALAVDCAELPARSDVGVQCMNDLDKLQLEALYGSWIADNDRPGFRRPPQLPKEVRCHLQIPLEVEGVDWPADEGAESFAHHIPGHLQERAGAHLHDKAVTIRQQ